jgi:hypothetical protein
VKKSAWVSSSQVRSGKGQGKVKVKVRSSQVLFFCFFLFLDRNRQPGEKVCFGQGMSGQVKVRSGQGQVNGQSLVNYFFLSCIIYRSGQIRSGQVRSGQVVVFLFFSFLNHNRPPGEKVCLGHVRSRQVKVRSGVKSCQ